MKLYVELQVEGKAKGSWRWVLESDNGKRLGQSAQVHATKEACAKELKAIQAEFAKTVISERRSVPATPAAPPRKLPSKPVKALAAV